MIFKERFKEIRKTAGFSQEKVAEALDISRQAVANWESGAAMPDIDNLIGLSELFQVSLDYLVKESVAYLIQKKSDQKADYSHAIEFLVEAKQNTYAAGEGSAQTAPSSRLASTDLQYEKGDFKYLDTFVGGTHFSGEEVVWHQEKPMWAMNYSGRVLEDILGNFLKESLLRVSEKAPFRGPEIYRNGKYTYVNAIDGEFEWFQGVEKIFYEHELIYELFYHGGLVK